MRDLTAEQWKQVERDMERGITKKQIKEMESNMKVINPTVKTPPRPGFRFELSGTWCNSDSEDLYDFDYLEDAIEFVEKDRPGTDGEDFRISEVPLAEARTVLSTTHDEMEELGYSIGPGGEYANIVWRNADGKKVRKVKLTYEIKDGVRRIIK